MPVFNSATQAIIFDYGNTLIAFGRAEVDAFDQRLGAALEQRFGLMDWAAYKDQRNADRMAPYVGAPPEYRESEVREMTAALIRRIYGVEPDAATLDYLIQVRQEAFVAVVRAEAQIFAVLDRLRAGYRIALLSNYPDGDAIRQSLGQTGLAPYFEAVLVSGDIGLCKPHPATFQAVLDKLGLQPHECVFVGDNWLADVQGAKRMGMPVVHFTRWSPPEHFDRIPGDAAPDAVIAHLEELLAPGHDCG